MSFRFEERSYSGRNFRPRPEIHLDAMAKILIVATPWGPRSGARKVIERMVEYLALSRDDREATSPFQRLTCLSAQANNLRIATLLANEALYREDNRAEYKSGVELFACVLEEDELVFIQAGNPQLILDRPGQTITPLGSCVDLAFDMSEGSHIQPALPSNLLGLDPTINFGINGFRARAGDRLILLSHSYVPQSLFTLKPGDASVDTVTRILGGSHQDLAFWLGALTIDETARSQANKASSAQMSDPIAGDTIEDADHLVSSIMENI